MESYAKMKASKRKQAEFEAGEIISASEALTEDNSDHEENESDSERMENDTDEPLHDAKTSNAGWADAMQKILRTNKPKGKKTVVLAKAKKLCDVKEKEEAISFEIDDAKDEINTESKEADVKIGMHTTQIKPKIREKSLGIRLKPSITDREYERTLQKIATRGVVQLFNAVRQQQTEISKKLSQAGPLERKREQVLKSINKNAFLDILMGDSKSISVENAVNSDKPVEQTNNKHDEVWNVLREDFVMGAKLKDWDKKDAEEEDSSAPEDMDSDAD